MAKKKKQPPKLGEIKLTDEERAILTEGINSEFFKIIQTKILPQRRVQLALTIAEADHDMLDVQYHRGMIRMCAWLPDYMTGDSVKVDTAKYDNDDETDDAEDEVL